MPSVRSARARTETAATFVVERYAVFGEFAAGGMATVHFARLLGAHGFRRTVAVKRLLPHLTRNHEFALMLIDEARLAARVCHPNVVTTLDVVQTETELLLVMEYVHGESLAKLSRWTRERGERIPTAIACAIMADALHGLHAAHEAKDERGADLGLVHRDVSPQNVLVGLDGIPRIADFGIAKAAGRAQTTRDGILKGKLAYMAPEQLSGGQVSRVSDVFAAAVVLWELLTGERLFAGQNHAETTFKVLSAPIAAPSHHNASIPAALDAVLMRGLARAPEQRFPSAREMALALERCVPSVRPSELASWVAHVVGERLSSRSSLLRSIEREGEVDTQEHTRLRGPLDPAHDALPAAPNELAPPAEVDLLASHGTEAVQSDLYARRRPRAGRTLVGATLLALLALAALAALRWHEPSLPARSVPMAGSAAVQSDDAARNVPARSPSAESRVVAPVGVVSDGVGDGRAKAPDKPRARSAREPKPGAKGPDCDPPFSIDAAGHVLFKPACM
jgi:serine/threonine-protein kinase